MSDSVRCGYVAIVGRPNVGKSTLLNRLVGQKLSITTRRPQTTRHQILGIDTTSERQIIYVDTPGIHRGQRRAINRYMNRAAANAIDEVDVVVFVVEALKWTSGDENIRHRLEQAGKPIILVPNKSDRVRDKSALLPYLDRFNASEIFTEIVPLSARHGDNVGALDKAVTSQLPQRAPVFPANQVTDRTQRFLAGEIVREKLTRRMGQEVPYQLTVEIEEFDESGPIVRIGAVVWVERRGHKQMVIGTRGQVLKAVGQEARHDLERILERRVYLRIWVKVRAGWSDDERALRTLGYEP